MSVTFIKRLFLSRWRLHSVCAILCLLACVPILWPRLPLAEDGSPVAEYAGILLSGAFTVSATMMVLIVVHLLLRLRNKKACVYMLAWFAQWSVVALIFVLMAIVADVPPLRINESSQPIQRTDTLHLAKDELTGPSALVIPISPESYTTKKVESTPYLSLLEAEHEAVLTEFLESSPRWAAQADDTFYSRPGHVVMVPPTTGGTPGLVHVGFRRLIEGEPLPQGFHVVKSGDAFPRPAAGQEQVPDLALDLGRNHYLLLAWRGTSHQETAHKALNAAIAAVDSRMQELADSPTHETAQSMAKGKVNMTGHTPELRLCEPPAQYGAYQAEIYANPQEPGTLLVYVRDLETNRTLRILNCPAQYSENNNELFRHDLPGSVPLWMRDGGFSSSRKLFAPEIPLFAIREGEPHHYFGVAFEVRFKPIDPRQPSRLILRRCYKVEAYEKPAPIEPRPSAGKRAPDELTPSVSLRAPMATAPNQPPTPEEKTKEAKASKAATASEKASATAEPSVSAEPTEPAKPVKPEETPAPEAETPAPADNPAPAEPTEIAEAAAPKATEPEEAPVATIAETPAEEAPVEAIAETPAVETPVAAEEAAEQASAPADPAPAVEADVSEPAQPENSPAENIEKPAEAEKTEASEETPVSEEKEPEAAV